MDFLNRSLDMKKIVLPFLIIVTVQGTLRAQSWEEWFQQGPTQKKYLLQQIAALRVYAGQLQKGYTIAREGLAMIGAFTKGELDAHSDYFNSLKKVNPAVKHYANGAALIALHAKIVHGYPISYRRLRNSTAFSPEELGYIHSVFKGLLDH